MIALLLLHIATAEEVQEPERAEPALWAGRMAVFGERRLPFIGSVAFRNDNFVIASVTTGTDGSVQLEQSVCRVSFEKVAGAQASMKETAPRAMPVATPHFIPDGNGQLNADAWPSGWDANDHDSDGYDGIAVHVNARLCGGTMHMSSDAMTVARALPHEGGLKGRANIRVTQTVHKVQGACLSLVTKDVTQDLAAQFVYLPVPAGADCDSIGEDFWPDPVGLDLSAVEAPSLPAQKESR